MTFEEVSLACKGYEVRIAREKEIQRLHATWYLNVHSDQRYMPEDIYPLITDKERPLMTKDEYFNIQELVKKVKWQTN
jgi:hypothetical protein